MKSRNTKTLLSLVLASPALFSACDDTADAPSRFEPNLTFAEDSSARYVGQMVVSEEYVASESSGTTLQSTTNVVEFDPSTPTDPERTNPDGTPRAVGPSCLFGDPYKVLYQPGAVQESDIVIHMAGGGICFPTAESLSDCLLETDGSGPNGLPERWLTGTSLINSDPSLNPLTANWHRVFMQYCDGSLYVGDADFPPITGDTRRRNHRGPQNFAAALQVAYGLNPNPERVLIYGVAGGGYGAALHLQTVATVFPDAEVLAFTDGGPLISLVYGQTSLLGTFIELFRAHSLVPESCNERDCVDSGNLTEVLADVLSETNNPDGKMRLALASSYNNTLIGRTFLDLPNDMPFVDIFVPAVESLEEQAREGSYGGFYYNGSAGTAADAVASGTSPYNLTAGGVSLGVWLASFIDNDEGWGTVQDTRPTDEGE